MKKWIKFELAIVLFAVILVIIASCTQVKAEDSKPIVTNDNTKSVKTKKELSKEFKEYWYAGDAEITSYKLEQARYGELREGKAVLIYVTEPFNANKQVKAEFDRDGNIPILKLNRTKKYLTGIYPYSLMSSSFYPVHDDQQALKVTFSAQEWCGQVFAQINNHEKFKIRSFSYFESEGDIDIELEKNVLENELWNRIRVNPFDLPIGALKMIPDLEYIRMAHKELAAYNAIASLTTNDGFNIYRLTYPELDRTLEIKFESSFPYTIESWTDSFKSGFGSKAQTMTSKATKIKTLKTPYWRQNRNNDIFLRDTLGL
ncbi:MAG: septum formation inhibitor Maf [Maribacter sp.]|nr:septum formation inhibitor Maf [Maribacter sp.]